MVYAERALSTDPNVRRRLDEPFSNLEYALYLGDQEDAAHLLGASVRDLPIEVAGPSLTIPYGDQEILLVTTPIGRLGGPLTTHLWWIVLAVGGLGTALTVALLRRLNLRPPAGGPARPRNMPASTSSSGTSPRRSSSACCRNA